MAGDGLPRAYWRLFGATTASTLGDGLLIVGLPLLAESASSSALGVAGLLVARRLPWIIGIVFGGFADRREPRATMILMDLIRAVLLLALGFAVIGGTVPIYLLYIAAFAHATADVVFLASAQSVLPRLVPPELRGKANGYLDSISANGEQLVGPPVGGLLFGVARALPVVADGASFVVSAMLLRGIPALPRDANPKSSRGSFQSELGHAVRYFRATQRLRWNVLMTIPMAFTQAMSLGVLVIVSRRTLDLSTLGTGLFFAGIAAGNVVGGLVAPRLMTRMSHPNLLLAAFTTVAISYLAVVGERNPYVVSGALFFEGVAVVVSGVTSVTLRQQLIPDAMRGRLSALSRGLVYFSISIGALVGGVLTDWFGTDAVFALASLIILSWVMLAGSTYRHVQHA